MRLKDTASLILLLLIRNVCSTVLECEFKWQISHWGRDYACVPKIFRTSLEDRNVTEVNGIHDLPNTNFDVKKLFIKKQSCPYLPLNIGSHFKNLETFYLMNSNLQHLLNGDLDGLTQLKVFDVSHNPIEQLGLGFFENHPSIEIISFFDCHLKMIHPLALEPLVHLKEGHFQQNVCIDFHVEDATGIQALKTEILDKCQSKYYNEIFDRVSQGTSEKTSSCESTQALSTSTSQSFTRRNANLIISFQGILLIILCIALARIIRSTFNNNWTELKSSLI